MDSLSHKVDQQSLDDAIEKLKVIISSMSGGESVAVAFDNSDIKDAIKKLQNDVATL